MGTIKTYTVNHGATWWECRVSIDHGFLIKVPVAGDAPPEEWTMEKAMREMILFWTGGKHRLNMNDDDVTKTFLQQLGAEIQTILVEHSYNLEGVKAEFVNREGWWPMDGSNGVEILDVEDFEFDITDYEVLEEPQL